MKIYWSYRSIPELAPLSRKQQDQLWQANCYLFLRHWQGWTFGALPIFVLGGLGGYYLGLLGEMIGCGIGGFIMGLVSVSYARPGIREALSSQEQVSR